MNKRIKKIFVAGTDTGVGKTLVATGLAINWKAHYWKPIQTGEEEGTDSQFASHFLPEGEVFPESYVLKAPLSPNQAAEIEAKKIELSYIQNHSWIKIQNHSSLQRLVIEGAGGVFVPLNNKEHMMELIKSLEAPVLLVARRGLGTLNHSLLSLEALRKREISVLGLVLVGSRHAYNKKTLEEWGQVRVLCEVDWKRSLGRKSVTSAHFKKEFFNLAKTVDTLLT